MKRYQITLDGRTFDVQVLSDPQQERVEVKVDGETFAVEVKSAPGGELGSAAVGSEVGTTIASAPHLEPAPSPSMEAAKPAAAPLNNLVTAPLPGVIKSIAVRPGQHVSIGDRLLVIEAMKMDNVLRASHQGVIETIHTAEGHQVAHGELLLEYRT